MRVLPASSAPLRWCLFLRQGAPEGKQGKPEAKSYFMSQIGSLEPAPLASVRPSLFSPTVIPQALKAGRDAGKAARAQGVALPVHSPASPPKTRKPASFRSPGAALGGAAKRAASPGLPVSAAPAKAARVAVVDKVSSVFSLKR